MNATALNITHVIQALTRLARLMAQEVEFLKAMKVSEIEALQADKAKFTQVLEFCKGEVRKNPAIISEASDDQKQELKSLMDVFEQIAGENHRRLMVAREVNAMVVQAIKDAVAETDGRLTYEGDGTSGDANRPLSLTLNQTI